jgi:hypothetical protein
VTTERPVRLDLSRPRAYGELLQTTFEVFSRHGGVFLTLALVLVTPVTLLVDGVWGRALADGPKAEPPLEAQTVSAGLRVFVILPLVTAANVLIVQGLASGDVPSVGDALRAGARVFPRVVGAVVVYVAAVLAGFILLIIPGVWMAIRGYFAAQAAVVDAAGPAGALRRSSELVAGNWWRTLGYLVATGLIFGLAGSILIAIVGATGSAALYVAALIVVEAAAVSLTAIFATLLFFDLRARRSP